MATPTQEEVRRLFDYDTEGWLLRQTSPSQNTRIGDRAGSLNRKIGYLQVSVNNVKEYGHRLVWIWHYGDIPAGLQVDHADGDRANNRVENLRLASQWENTHNSRRSLNNTSGVKGVCWDKRREKWLARLSIDRKVRHLGYYECLGEAEEVVMRTRQECHGEFCNHG